MMEFTVMRTCIHACVGAYVNAYTQHTYMYLYNYAISKQKNNNWEMLFLSFTRDT